MSRLNVKKFGANLDAIVACLISDIVSASGFEKLEICPQFAQFEFGSWNLEEPVIIFHIAEFWHKCEYIW